MNQEIVGSGPTRTLSTIVADMLDVLDASNGEVSARLDEISAELEEKAQAYAAVVRQLESEKQAFEDLATAYRAKAATRENTITGLKFRMEQALGAAGIEKLKTSTATWYFQGSKRCELDDEAVFLESAEDRFVVVKTVPNKTEIKKALEAGEQVAGASLVETKHLRFR
jgi:hypothetical protein